MEECTDRLWVQPRVCRPMGRVSVDILDEVLCLWVGTSVCLDKIGCPLTMSGTHWDNEKGANIEGEAALPAWNNSYNLHLSISKLMFSDL